MFNLSNFTLHPKRSTLSQTGATSLIIVALLLIGITAAVYLTQTGTSFLPQAAPPDDGIFRIEYAQSCNEEYYLRGYTIYQGSTLVESGNTTCPMGNYRPCNDYMKLFCGKQNQACYKWGSHEARCLPPAAPPENTKPEPCTLEEISASNLMISHCDYKTSSSNKIIGNSCKDLEEGNNYNYYCYRPQATQPQPAPAAPGAPPAPTSQTTDGGCSQPETDSCKGICYKDSSGTKQCTPSKENASGCDASQQKQCTDKGRNNGCMIIRGEIKCLYSDGASCDSDDSRSCSQGCAVVQREGYWVSECKATTCSQGYHNFCMATKNKSCEIKDGVPDCTGDPAKAPKPQAAAPAAAAQPRPATGQGAAPAATQPQRQGQGASQPQAQTLAAPQPAAPLICGKDKDNLDIPCYAMGVFGREELTSREAQAKIASVNYTLFRDILTKEQDRIGAEIKSNAEKKIAAAEAAMKACVQK